MTRAGLAGALSFVSVTLAAPMAMTPAGAPETGPVSDDRAISVGGWEVISVEWNGKPVDKDVLSMLHVDFRADGSWTVRFKRIPVAEGRSTNRQDRSPKTFDMETLGSEEIAPRRYVGIYRLDGDVRVLCIAADGSPRPEDFSAPRRSGRMLVTLRRAMQP